MASSLWVVRPAIVTLYTAAFAGTDVTVFDGPRPRSAAPKKFLLVGANSGLDDGTPGLRSVQSPSPMGNTWRDETVEIDCVAVAWTGAEDMSAIRAAAKSIVDTCETAINADRSLGGLVKPNNNLIELVALDVAEARTDKGPFVEATFTLSYGTVLTS